MAQAIDAAQLRSLHAIESIKTLKYRYFRALDQTLFEEVKQCFSADGYIDYGAAGVYEKVDDFVTMISDYAKTNTAVGIHQGFNPEISVDGDNATGYWLCTYTAVDSSNHSSFKQTGYYQDDYVCIDGEWKIKRTTNRPLFSEATNTSENTTTLTQSD